MQLDEDFIYPSFFRTVIGVYGFSFVMLLLAVLPGLNFAYSGHGGLAWFFIPLCGPWVTLRALYKIWHASGTTRKWYLWFFKVTFPAYIVSSLVLSWLAAMALQSTYGSTFPVRALFLDMVSPIPLWYFGYAPR
jgi:hypothetical protein